MPFIKCGIVLSIVLIQFSSVFAFKPLEKVALGDSRERFYLNFDHNGKSADSNAIAKIEAKIHTGDEIVFRYYPNYLFEESIEVGEKPDDDRSTRILFPPQLTDTFSVQAGYGSVVFATKEEVRFRLAMPEVDEPLLDSTVSVSKISQYVFDQRADDIENMGSKLQKQGYSKDWKARVFENIPFKPGLRRIEIYQITRDSAYLLVRDGWLGCVRPMKNCSCGLGL